VWPSAAVSERGPKVLIDPATVSAAAADEDPNNARVIVQYRTGSTLAKLAATAGRAQHAGRMGSRLGLPLVDGRHLGPHSQGLRGKGLSSRQLAARLSALPDVEWAVVDQRRTITAVLPNDPYYGPNQTSITPTVGQWYLRAPDTTVLSAINAEGAWAITTGSTAVTVAVIDTGVRFDHPDLAGKLWPGYDFVRGSISNDGDGPDNDASDSGDWSTAADSCGAANSSWHGTQVAGLIGAASDNNLGMAGVGRNVMVLPIRALGRCGGFDSDIQAAMLWAAGLTNSPVPNPHPARVINLSLGSPGSCGSYQPVINQLLAAGVTVVVAAGNSTGLAVNSPANCAGAIAVAGVRHAGAKVGYSSLGPQVTLAAPAGNCVNETGPCLYPLLTTLNAGTTAPGANIYSDSLKPSLGTSFASPLVAGTVALMLSADPTLTPANIKVMLQATVRPFPTTGAQTPGATACVAPSATTQVECYCTTKTCGAGMLDTESVLARVDGLVVTLTRSASVINPGIALAADGLGTVVHTGRSVASYQWTLIDDGAGARFVGAATNPTVSVVAERAGKYALSLAVTDSAGITSRTSNEISVAKAPTVDISVLNSAVAGQFAEFSGAASRADEANGRSVTGYQWSIGSASNSAGASIVGASDTSTVSILPAAVGSFLISLRVIDSGGLESTAVTTSTVGLAPVVVTPPPGSGGGGGGAMGWGWMLGLASAILLLARRRRS
jgi:serine protease